MLYTSSDLPFVTLVPYEVSLLQDAVEPMQAMVLNLSLRELQVIAED